nr:MAG TPA: hypothetical protein [Caudoviricetes sp.]
MRDRVGLRDCGFIGVQVALAIIAEELNLRGVLITTRFRYLSDLWQLGPFFNFANRAGTAARRVFVCVCGVDVAKSDSILRNRVDFRDNVINTRPVAVHVNDITDRDIVCGANGDHCVLSIRRAGESNGRAVARCQIDMSAVRQCKAHNGYSFRNGKTGSRPVCCGTSQRESVGNVCPIIQADRNGVGHWCMDAAEYARRAANPAGKVFACNFQPLGEQFRYSARQGNDGGTAGAGWRHDINLVHARISPAAQAEIDCSRRNGHIVNGQVHLVSSRCKRHVLPCNRNALSIGPDTQSGGQCRCNIRNHLVTSLTASSKKR